MMFYESATKETKFIRSYREHLFHQGRRYRPKEDSREVGVFGVFDSCETVVIFPLFSPFQSFTCTRSHLHTRVRDVPYNLFLALALSRTFDKHQTDSPVSTINYPQSYQCVI